MFTCWPITPNIAGFYMLRPFAHPVTCCFVLLGIVAQSLKPVKRLSQQVPTFLLFRDQRSVAQQCWIPAFVQIFQHCQGHARALHMVSFKFTMSYGLYPSHDALQVPTLLGVVAPVCTQLPTRTHQRQHCWANNVESSLRPLHLLSIRLYTFFIAENIDTHLSYKTLSTKVFRNFSLSLLHSRFQCRHPTLRRSTA